jgi:hypothetical protein
MKADTVFLPIVCDSQGTQDQMLRPYLIYIFVYLIDSLHYCIKRNLGLSLQKLDKDPSFNEGLIKVSKGGLNCKKVTEKEVI